MPNQVLPSRDFLEQFTIWGDSKRKAILDELFILPEPLNEQLNQGILFHKDVKRYIHNLSTESKYEIASLAQYIATIAISPYAIIAELYRLCNRSITASTCLKNICIIPKHIGLSLFKSILFIANDANKVVNAGSIGVGVLAWHSGEAIVRFIKDSSHTVLSNNPNVRDIVYRSLGLTLLAGTMAFAPLPTIQMLALPIIFGSIYGTINNQFTIRECPEYYTMGHYFDGTDLKGHAIKTNNVIIKPIVTGCYATTTVTPIAGAILAAAAILPYTAKVLPVPYAGAMIASVTLISLISAHVFSNIEKDKIKKNLEDYAHLLDIQWTPTNLNMKWRDFLYTQDPNIANKQEELASNPKELEKFNKKLYELTQAIECHIMDPRMTMKYITGWQANSTRNGIGYLFAGGGTLAIAITTIFLRIFAL